MKQASFILLLLLLFTNPLAGQWSNSTNDFYDSLHIVVSAANNVQENPLIVRSYPDGGFFVIWEDERNSATTRTDIYAQKFDANGRPIWTADGVPVSNGPNRQHYTFNSVQDYRSRSFAATDSAGGLYVCFIDDSISNTTFPRICVQHLRPDGSRVFGQVGYIVATTTTNNNATYNYPQLVADGRGGYFIGFIRFRVGESLLIANCYRDENGVMKYYGGGTMNEHQVQTSQVSPCGIQTRVIDYGTSTTDYNMWPDGQGGCNFTFSLYSAQLNNNNGIIGYNKLWRAKKNSSTRTLYRNADGRSCPLLTNYKKDDVFRLYELKINTIVTTCGGGSGPVYVVTSQRIRSEGYLAIDADGRDWSCPKGVSVALGSTARVRANVIAVSKRKTINNTIGNYHTVAFVYKDELYDSIPYQVASFNNPDFGYNTLEPSLENISPFRDTVLASNVFATDFSMAATERDVYLTGFTNLNGNRSLRLQHLQFLRINADSFAISYASESKAGDLIGREVNTGFGNNSIFFDFPQISISREGIPMFFIREYNRAARVSPIEGTTRLRWGAMGRPISTGHQNGFSYNLEQPVAVTGSRGASMVMAWRDNSNLFTHPNSSANIRMRRIDDLSLVDYQPPLKPAMLVPNPFGPTAANPSVLFGSTKAWTPIELRFNFTNNSTTTVAEILDSLNLGFTEIALYQHTGTIRRQNSIPYLSRNYSFKTENNIGAAGINLRLYFTRQEFDALKAADNSITSPADLIVIRQPFAGTTPATYLPSGSDEVIAPLDWGETAGGFYLTLRSRGLGTYFIQKAATVQACPETAITLNASVGSSYIWQVDTGSGFADLANGTQYNGVNTPTLTINNAPSTFYGYKYRCLVDGSSGAVFFLQFVNTWNGGVDNKWETAANWSCNVVPDGKVDVIIKSGSITVNSNVNCRSISVQPTASISVTNGFSLTVQH